MEVWLASKSKHVFEAAASLIIWCYGNDGGGGEALHIFVCE